ncbi:hypothetical protein L1987_60849 [Smallanthus sonchifolius]|uniref:Uncharacterized protein n=1 Tax=Smallanthus sonchifolius TaxID=185202 RepID=A0ACB9D9F3_9ASTR|nr:hypothetical protein L1987_60849 [Smallanthus sonchifolius]
MLKITSSGEAFSSKSSLVLDTRKPSAVVDGSKSSKNTSFSLFAVAEKKDIKADWKDPEAEWKDLVP